MSELRNSDRLADRIRLHRQADKRPVIVTEGPTDIRFLARVLPAASYTAFQAGTRDLVLTAIEDLATARLPEVAGLVDRDFDDSVARAENVGLPVCVYDGADLEEMLWRSRALDEVVVELASASKLEALGGVVALREIADDTLLPLQRLRRASAMLGWRLEFDSLDLRARISRDALSMNRQSLCDALWRPDSGATKADLYDASLKFTEARCPRSGQPLVRGKDCVAVLAVALRRRLSNLGHQSTNPERLAEALRLAVSRESISHLTWRKRLLALIGI